MEATCDIRGAALKTGTDGFPDPLKDLPPLQGTQSAVFAAGCFWCVEAVFTQLEGVHSVVSVMPVGHRPQPITKVSAAATPDTRKW